MNCEQAKPLIQPYADGELDAGRILELEKHFQDCTACARVWNDLRTLKKAVKQEALYFNAPAELRRQIKTELRSLSGAPRQNLWNWLTAATTAVAAVCLALLLTIAALRPSAQQQLAQEIVSGHVRSLMANHTLDVVSSDQHTVKPWFDGKLDFAPPVKDLAAQDFPLTGGRLDYLDGRSVAALVFQHRKHVINLFIWPAKEADVPPAALAPMQGYNVIHWSGNGMTFWAVSDLNEKELMDFAQAFGKESR